MNPRVNFSMEPPESDIWFENCILQVWEMREQFKQVYGEDASACVPLSEADRDKGRQAIMDYIRMIGSEYGAE